MFFGVIVGLILQIFTSKAKLERSLEEFLRCDGINGSKSDESMAPNLAMSSVK